jgi:hypothetical protein
MVPPCGAAFRPPFADLRTAMRIFSQTQFEWASTRRPPTQYRLSPPNMRAATALLVLREHVIRPLLTGVQTPPCCSKPTTWIATDQHYEQLRLSIQPLFQELGIAA